jgi:SnoaL-like polyketide cyclase
MLMQGVNVMPTGVEQLAAELIRLVEERKFLEAIEKFYAPDAAMQENDEAPRVGLAALLAGERKALAYFKEIHVSRAASFLAHGDRVAINWIFEYTDPNGRRHRMNEIAYQQWREGKIIHEKFFYDPAQRQVEVAAEA